MISKELCMSSFLTLRYIYGDIGWKDGLFPCNNMDFSNINRTPCANADDVDKVIRSSLSCVDLSHAALLLSGGIDSGILASYMPKGCKTYTLKNKLQLTDLEVKRAKEYCDINQLEHNVVEIDWDFYDKKMDTMMKKSKSPISANEAQIHILVEKAVEEGADIIIFGDAADSVFGGYDRKLAKDWTFDEWVNEFVHVDPRMALKEPADMNYVFEKYRLPENKIDYIKFIEDILNASSGVAYYNSFSFFDIKFLDPYTKMVMSEPLDLNRVRNGESKYILRDLFKRRYPNLEIPEKLPMPRPMDEWMSWWDGPQRDEFISNCHRNMTGEQRFLVYSLERFLDTLNL